MAKSPPITSTSSVETSAVPSSVKSFFSSSTMNGQRNTLPNLVFLGRARSRHSDCNQQAALSYLQSRAGSWIRTQNQNVYLGKATGA